jgi:hypothetical protein
MERYHKEIGFKHVKELMEATSKLNSEGVWKFTNHGLEKALNRVNSAKIWRFLPQIQLSFADIFEYYAEESNILKVCYRVAFTALQDLCLVVTPDKTIITCYLNDKGDNHKGLNKKLYVEV